MHGLAAGFALDARFHWLKDGMERTKEPTLRTVARLLADREIPRDAVHAAEPVALADLALRVIRASDLLHEKLRAARDPGRRRSKRLQDLADAQSLLEQQPELASTLDDRERGQLTGLGV